MDKKNGEWIAGGIIFALFGLVLIFLLPLIPEISLSSMLVPGLAFIALGLGLTIMGFSSRPKFRWIGKAFLGLAGLVVVVGIVLFSTGGRNPGQAQMGENARNVCANRAMPAAAAYNPANDLHPAMIFIDGSSRTPARLLPASEARLELVLCGSATVSTVDTCRYDNNRSVARKQETLTVTIYIAQNGGQMGTFTLTGPKPGDCPSQLTVRDGVQQTTTIFNPMSGDEIYAQAMAKLTGK